MVSGHVVPGLKMAAVGSPGSLESAPRIMRLVAECSRSGARAGELRLPHGTVATPVFMPVGTQATMKGITTEQLDSLGCRICLGNTYHLGLRPVCGFDLGGGWRGGLWKSLLSKAHSAGAHPHLAVELRAPLTFSPSQGPELIRKAQGLHGFMNWPHNLLTVSWGCRPRALR